MSELQKAYEDMVIYGSGAIIIEGDEITHIPAGDIHVNTEHEFAKVKKIEGKKGKIVAMDELNPMNRKQLRIQASKERRGKNKGLC